MWDVHYSLETLPLLAAAFVNAVIITVEAFVAAALGAILILLLLSGPRLTAGATAAVSDFVRKTPILVQIYFFYYVLPGVGVTLSAWFTGVLALALHYSFYLADVYRAALNAIPKGQWEAARALGLHRLQIYCKVVAPQVLPLIIPNAGNYFIYMLKDTPYLAAITVTESMKVASKLGSEYFRYIEPITICGLLFLGASWMFAALFSFLERCARGKWAPR